MNIQLIETENPFQDIPENRSILFYDSCGIDIGERRGDFIVYPAELKDGSAEMCQISLAYVSKFAILEINSNRY